nr:MAG TPA: hypothetical protein [Caudoviricetes sp.]
MQHLNDAFSCFPCRYFHFCIHAHSISPLRYII